MTRLYDKLIGIILGVKFSFEFLWKNSRLSYFYISVSMLLTILNSFLQILFPKYLLDNLTARELENVFVIILIFCVWQLLFTILNELIDKNQEVCSEKNRILLKILLADKIASLRYEQLDNPETLKQYEFAQKCVDKGSVEKYVKNVVSVFSSAVVIGGIIYILKDLPAWILILIIIVIAANAIGVVVRAKNSYVQATEETPIERELYYLRGGLMNKKYGKEIRCFQLSNFILSKTRQAIEAFFYSSKVIIKSIIEHFGGWIL